MAAKAFMSAWVALRTPFSPSSLGRAASAKRNTSATVISRMSAVVKPRLSAASTCPSAIPSLLPCVPFGAFLDSGAKQLLTYRGEDLHLPDANRRGEVWVLIEPLLE